MSKYEDFDRLLLADIATGKHTFMKLEKNKALRDAAPLGKPFFRSIDSRLQSLSKAGKIRYTGKVWEVVA